MRGACTFLHLRKMQEDKTEKMQQDKTDETVSEFRARVPWRQYPWKIGKEDYHYQFREDEIAKVKRMEDFLADPTCPIHPDCRARLLNNLRAVVYDDFSNARKFVEELETDLYVLSKQRVPVPYRLVEVSETRESYKEESLRKMEALFFPELRPKEERDLRMLLHVRQKEKLLTELLSLLEEEEKLLRGQMGRKMDSIPE